MLPQPTPAPPDPQPTASTQSAPARRPLRAVPGGYDPNRLPLTVRPVADETAASWAGRLSRRYRIDPQALLGHVGIEVASLAPQAFQAAAQAHRQQLAAAFGLADTPDLLGPAEPSRALRLVLRRYVAEYLPRPVRPAAGSRYCPACLRSSRGGVRAPVVSFLELDGTLCSNYLSRYALIIWHGWVSRAAAVLPGNR